MSQHERVTFTQGREVIEHALRHLGRIRDVIDDLRGRSDHPERVRMLLESVEVEQRNLLGAVARLLEDGSRKALDTYAQYTVELPMSVGEPEEPLTTLSFVQWLERQNGFLYSTFAELADKGDNEEASQMFRGLADQVQSHERRLSKEYQRLEDL